MERSRRLGTCGAAARTRASRRPPVSSWSGLAAWTALLLLCLSAGAGEADAQASRTGIEALAQQRLPPRDDGIRLLDPRPLALDSVASLRPIRRGRRAGAGRSIAHAAPATLVRAEVRPVKPAPSSAPARPTQTRRRSADAEQDHDGEPAAPSSALFDLRRLTASVLFDASPQARAYSGTLGLTYVATDHYQVGVLLPVAYFGGFANPLMVNNVTLRNTFVQTLGDNRSFFGVTADAALGGNTVFRHPNTFLTISPFLGLGLPNRFDLFASVSWGASIAATATLTRELTDEWSVGLEYSRTAGVAGQLLPVRDQPQTVFGVAELNRDGRRFTFGLGATFASGGAGPAARFGVTQSFQ